MNSTFLVVCLIAGIGISTGYVHRGPKHVKAVSTFWKIVYRIQILKAKKNEYYIYLIVQTFQEADIECPPIGDYFLAHPDCTMYYR